VNWNSPGRSGASGCCGLGRRRGLSVETILTLVDRGALSLAFLDEPVMALPERLNYTYEPAVNDPKGEQESELRAWLVQQAGAGARILGACAGKARERPLATSRTWSHLSRSWPTAALVRSASRAPVGRSRRSAEPHTSSMQGLPPRGEQTNGAHLSRRRYR
jgi:hypothetical protein